MPKGVVTAFFLSMKWTFECIVKRVFGCLDIYMTHKLGFTLNLESKFFTFFCTLRHCEQSAAILCFLDYHALLIADFTLPALKEASLLISATPADPYYNRCPQGCPLH